MLVYCLYDQIHKNVKNTLLRHQVGYRNKVLTKVRNDLKRSKTDLKSSKTIKNNQNKNLIDSPKVFVLDFRTQVGTRLKTKDADLKTKTRSVTRTLKPYTTIQFRS